MTPNTTSTTAKIPLPRRQQERKNPFNDDINSKNNPNHDVNDNTKNPNHGVNNNKNNPYNDVNNSKKKTLPRRKQQQK
ncbi:hypothetical protein ElyMa_005037800 [Elysia marginata]|uniref:Uncharacterized protein n=1 Tax=Elysia marginata TaxID=1093978 RepID=A0AAV4JF71_9GAST|nr:hypothetical protein ElyMa_005037800 [Elysia marginata]